MREPVKNLNPRKQHLRATVHVPLTTRRLDPRVRVTSHQQLSVAVRYGQGLVCQGRVLNLSGQGMLVEFFNGQLPPVRRNAKVSVKLQYMGDSIWVPGLVRHHQGQKMGFQFPTCVRRPSRTDSLALNTVLHSLSRASSSL